MWILICIDTSGRTKAPDQSSPGEVLKPDSYKAIDNEEMPVYKPPFMKGTLYVHLNVQYPNYLTREQPDLLENQNLVTELRVIEVDDCEETTLSDVNIEEEM